MKHSNDKTAGNYPKTARQTDKNKKKTAKLDQHKKNGKSTTAQDIYYP